MLCCKLQTLHANQIIQLRELFVPESQGLALLSPAAEEGATLTKTHIHIQEAADTLVPITTPQFLFSSLLASSICAFRHFSLALLGFCSVGNATFALCRLSQHVLHSLSSLFVFA